jgi:hypothetical protein
MYKEAQKNKKLEKYGSLLRNQLNFYHENKDKLEVFEELSKQEGGTLFISGI